MIDAAAQVLLSVSNAKNNTDKSAMFKRDQDSGSSFGEVFNNSKSQSEKDPEDVIARRNQSRASESSEPNKRQNTRTSSDDGTKVNNEESQSAEKNAAPPKTESKTDVAVKADDSVEAEKTDEASVKEGSTSTIEKELSKAAAEIVEDSLGVDAAEIAVDADVLKAAADDEALAKALIGQSNEKGLKVGHELQALKGDTESEKPKLGQLAQSIVSEFKASKDKVEVLEGAEKTSRLKVLSDIEKALVKTDSPEEKLTPEKLLKPDLAANINAAKVLSEQVKPKDLNLATQVEIDPELIVEGEELAGSLETATDTLIEKILQRLDLSKLKGEENHLSKVANDKASIAEFVEQLSTKMNADSNVGTLLSAASSLTAKSSVMPPPQQLAMNTNINQPQWGTDFSKRIQFMINSDIKHAELRLDPPELGRINIKISMNQDQASVVFTSAHGNVRENIENTLPRLRELLQESGIQLGDANVNERQKGDEHQAGDSNLAGPILPGFDEDTDQEDAPKAVIQHSVDGVIDYFA